MFKTKSLFFSFFSFFLFSLPSVFSQSEIITSKDFFAQVSEQYGKIKDFEANVTITQGKQDMAGHISFKRPDLLRIDFSKPEEQVILFNGDDLTIYLPKASAVLNQSVTADQEGQTGANLATPQGLSLMSRYYTVAYEVGQEAVPLEEGSSQMVVKLILYRKNTAEAFRYIKLSITPETLLIKRVEAVTPQAQTFIFDFDDYVTNQGILDQRFIYDAPASANNYNNFLFSQ